MRFNGDMTLAAALEQGPVHFLGLGGAGVSGAARVLLARGVSVTGHDRAPSDLLRAFQRDWPQVAVATGASDAAHLPAHTALVVRSAAVPDDDPQVVAALARGLAVLKYAELLGRLAAPETGLAVAGTHGKTTTSWMLWQVLLALDAAGYGRAPSASRPGALVGGLLPIAADSWVAQASATSGSVNALAPAANGWFAMEACEYDRSFLQLDPFGAIVTNVEADHLDYYGDLAAIERAFGAFVGRVASRGLVVLGTDVAPVVEQAAFSDVWRLGREISVHPAGLGARGRRFQLRGPGWATPPIELNVPGAYNVSNAALALALGIGLTLRARAVPRDEWNQVAAAAARGVEAFMGSGRRFELWGCCGLNDAVRVVHDYAHHPTELAALLSATRETYPSVQIHVLFQPHQASRTARFLREFAEVLSVSPERRLDRLVVAPVYGARRHIDGAFDAGSEALAALAMESSDPGSRAFACAPASLAEATDAFTRGLELDQPTIALVVGAGDVEDVRGPLLAALEQSSKQDLSNRAPVPLEELQR